MKVFTHADTTGIVSLGCLNGGVNVIWHGNCWVLEWGCGVLLLVLGNNIGWDLVVFGNRTKGFIVLYVSDISAKEASFNDGVHVVSECECFDAFTSVEGFEDPAPEVCEYFEFQEGSGNED